MLFYVLLFLVLHAWLQKIYIKNESLIDVT